MMNQQTPTPLERVTRQLQDWKELLNQMREGQDSPSTINYVRQRIEELEKEMSELRTN